MEGTEANPKDYEIVFYAKAESYAPVRDAVTASGGTIVEERPFEKVRLEYPVRKETYAFSGCARVGLLPATVADVSRALSLSSGVLRHMITIAETPAAPAEEGEKKPQGGKRPLAPRAVPKEPPILTNEALERKIEEILK